jgi:hypothetical protein
MLRIKTLIFLFFLVIFALSDPLIDFFSEIAGERDYCMTLQITFHVRDPERNEFPSSDPKASFFFAIRNMEDFYFQVLEPEIFKGVEFIYFSDSDRLYSGFQGNYSIDIFSLKDDYMIQIVQNIVDSLKEPLFSIRKEDKGKYVEYSFDYTSVMIFIIKRLKIEPIRVVTVVEKTPPEIKEIRFLGNNEEYVKLSILSFQANCDVERFFKIQQGF